MGDPIVLGDYTGLSVGAIKGRLGRTSAKTGERGRARVSMEIVAEPLVHNFDELVLGKAPCEAIAGALRGLVEGISENVSDRTLETRKYQERAFAAGKGWARERFGGKRKPLSDMSIAPRPGEARMFNHSGTFARSLVATENRTDKSWTVNASVNRLDPRTSHDAGEFAFITTTLIRLVPEFADPARLARHQAVQAAIGDSINSLILDARRKGEQLLAQLRQARLNLFLGAARGGLSMVFGE